MIKHCGGLVNYSLRIILDSKQQEQYFSCNVFIALKRLGHAYQFTSFLDIHNRIG